MVLLIDTNALLDYLMHREPNYVSAKKIIDFCYDKKANAYMAFHSISTIWYILRKKHINECRQLLLDLCKVVKVTGASHDDVISAIENEAFADFEDCLQEKCAQSVGADYIVTENIKDFKTSSVPAITSAEMADMLTIQ